MKDYTQQSRAGDNGNVINFQLQNFNSLPPKFQAPCPKIWKKTAPKNASLRVISQQTNELSPDSFVLVEKESERKK